MERHLPYYMAYPMPLVYDEEKVERRDFEYMKSLYPMTAKKLIPYVESECDRMEYEGSMIYDEYPDQLQLRLMCKRIYDKVKHMEETDEGPQSENWLQDLILLMLFQELFQRRCHHRRKGMSTNEEYYFYRNAGIREKYGRSCDRETTWL